MDKNELKVILKSISKDYFGANYYNEEEAKAAYKVIINQSPFRYYGNTLLRETEKFEESARKYFQVKYAHCVNSGTGAISCALHALDITIGDEVIVPGYFWMSVATCVLLRGGFPVLCEVDESFNINPEDLVKKITPRTKCLVLVHMDGVIGDLNIIREICHNNGITILEDFSQCVGGSYYGNKVGSFGDIAVASLQVNKVITSGEGGLILTNSEELYNKAVARSDFGLSRINNEVNEKTQQYITFGEGRRFNEISAAVMNVQLKKISYILKNMLDTKRYIKESLGNIQPIKYRKINDEEGEVATTLMLIFKSQNDLSIFMDIYKNEFLDNELKLYVMEQFGYHIYYNCLNLVNKVEALPGGWPWNLTKNEYHYEKGTLPKTDNLLARTIGMKIPGGITREQANAIVQALKYIINKYKEKVGVN